MVGMYVAPALNLDRFTCPHCWTLAPHLWDFAKVDGSPVEHVKLSKCLVCGRATLWEARGSTGATEWAMAYPDSSPAPLPNADLPDDVRADYDEASTVINRSPKGAAALLRLAVQRLCICLGQPGKNINDDI